MNLNDIADRLTLALSRMLGHRESYTRIRFANLTGTEKVEALLHDLSRASGCSLNVARLRYLEA